MPSEPSVRLSDFGFGGGYSVSSRLGRHFELIVFSSRDNVLTVGQSEYVMESPHDYNISASASHDGFSVSFRSALTYNFVFISPTSRLDSKFFTTATRRDLIEFWQLDSTLASIRTLADSISSQSTWTSLMKGKRSSRWTRGA